MITKSIYAMGSKGHHRFTLNVQEDSISVSDNSSLLSFKFIISATNSSWQWRSYYNITYSITIGTNTYTGTIPNFNGNTTTIKSVSGIEIVHDNDGTKTIPIAFSVTDPNTSVNYTCGNASESSAMILTDLHTPPDITNVNVTETNTLISGISNTSIARYLSRKTFVITATPYDEATISKYRIYNGNEILVESTTNTLNVDYQNVELQTNVASGITYAIVKIEVEDSIGGVRTNEYNYPLIEYQKPNIITTSSNIKRDGQSTGRVKLNLNATFTAGTIGLTTNDINTISLQFAYWQKGSSGSTTYYSIPTSAISISGNNITITNWVMQKNGSTISDVGSQAYYFKIKFTDAFGNIGVGQLLCNSSEYVMCKFSNRVDFKKITQQGNEVALKGESIFHSNSGDNTNITLSKNPFSHSIMEIFGTDQNGVKSLYHKILNPKENDEFDLSIVEAGTSNTFIKRTRYTLIGNAMQVSRAGSSRITSNSADTTTGTNDIYITDVIIYK